MRKTLRMTAVPKVEENASGATAEITIAVGEGAETWDSGKSTWFAMPEEQYRRYVETTRDAQDIHRVVATMVKKIDASSGRPITVSQTAVGDGAAKPTSSYNETEGGINITLEWQGDTLTVAWRGIPFDRMAEKVEIPFSARFRAEE